jgi:hypothetical protein
LGERGSRLVIPYGMEDEIAAPIAQFRPCGYARNGDDNGIVSMMPRERVLVTGLL